MNYSDIIKKVSDELGINKDLVDKTYKAYWLFIRESIQSLPLKDNLSKEEFSKLKTNFNIPSLGKLTCTYDRMMYIKDKYKEYNDKSKED